VSDNITWLSVLATIVILLVNEAALFYAQRRNPAGQARTAHATLREEWFAAVSKQAGSEILAVQTLRNSLMSATMTASTSVLGLVGAATLATPSLHTALSRPDVASDEYFPRLVLELVLMALLLIALACSAMAIRYYNHAGFICSMPIGSEERQRWSTLGSQYVRRAGIQYSWGLRSLILVAPILAAILYPAAGPVIALAVVYVLYRFERIGQR